MTIDEEVEVLNVLDHKHLTERDMEKYLSISNLLTINRNLGVNGLGFFQRRHYKRVRKQIDECWLCKCRYEEFSQKN